MKRLGAALERRQVFEAASLFEMVTTLSDRKVDSFNRHTLRITLYDRM
jgi:hypothetical protein